MNTQAAVAKADVHRMLNISGMIAFAKSTQGKLALLAEMADNATEEAEVALLRAKA